MPQIWNDNPQHLFCAVQRGFGNIIAANKIVAIVSPDSAPIKRMVQDAKDAGLKGLSAGDAQVSEKHAGFVINKGSATTNDILSLIKHIQKTVFDKTGVTLETEVKYVV